VIAAVVSPRATFLVAGLGVFAIVAIAGPLLGRSWQDRPAASGSQMLDGGNDVVLELIPGSSPIQKDRGVRL
jgi:hypothetical protein